jgi:peptidoglycan hydrolase CwlO-like protein
MSRLDKIERDIERTQEKAREIEAKLKELDGQRTEQENIEIVSAVRALKLTQEELRAFLKTGTLPAQEQEAIPAARFQKKKPEPEKADGDKQDSETPAAATIKTPYFESKTEEKTHEA